MMIRMKLTNGPGSFRPKMHEYLRLDASSHSRLVTSTRGTLAVVPATVWTLVLSEMRTNIIERDFNEAYLNEK